MKKEIEKEEKLKKDQLLEKNRKRKGKTMKINERIKK